MYYRSQIDHLIATHTPHLVAISDVADDELVTPLFAMRHGGGTAVYISNYIRFTVHQFATDSNTIASWMMSFTDLPPTTHLSSANLKKYNHRSWSYLGTSTLTS